MTSLGIDVARWQNPFALPYPAWIAAGLEVVLIQVTHGTEPEPVADEHLEVATAAGVPYLGAYHWLTPGQAEQQYAEFLSAYDAAYAFAALDVEQAGVTAADVLTWVTLYQKWNTASSLVLYGNNQLAAIIAAHPELRHAARGVWWAAYPTFPNPCTRPPFDRPRNVPAGLRLAGWQYAGNNGRLPPYSGAIDLTEWYEIPGAPMLKTVTGCLFGGHTQGFSSIIPTYRQLVAAGAVPPIIISDEDGGKMIEAQALGVGTRINRKHLPETGPDNEFEYGGDYQWRKNWPPDKVLRFQTLAVNLPYKASVSEFKATTHWQTAGNEWENQDVDGWLSDLDRLMGVLVQSEQRSTHDKAVLMGISDEEAATLPPVRYAIPVFNAGTPKTWEMYAAIADHPIWPLMARRGDIILCHEGIGFDEPFDKGANQPPTEGQPGAPGAGLVNFRIFNLLWLLEQRGIRLNWAVGEWYDGRRGRDTQIRERVANMIRHDLLLAASPFSATCLGYCQYEFTDDPNSKWYAQDCTLLWRSAAWQAHMVSQIGRINGETTMPISRIERQALLDQANSLYTQADAQRTNALALVSKIVAIVPDGEPAHWWDTWPAGIISPSRRLPEPTQLIYMRDAAGVPLTGVTKRKNLMDARERQGDLFRVLDTPIGGQMWWVKASDLPVPAPAG